MRRMIKRLLKKYKYPPEEAENAPETVIHQCEQWTDNDSDNYNSSLNETRKYDFHNETYPPMAADERVEYYTPKNNNKNNPIMNIDINKLEKEIKELQGKFLLLLE